MAKNEKTSKKVATKASKLLKDPKSSKDVKSVAGSGLTQAKDRKKPSADKKTVGLSLIKNPAGKTSSKAGSSKKPTGEIDISGTTRISKKKK